MLKMNRDREPGLEFEGKLDLLTPESIPATAVARERLQYRLIEKEHNMWQKIFGQKYRPAWAALVVFGVLAISLSFPQVRVIANSFLGLFRVESIEAVNVGISLESLPDEMETQFMALDSVIGDQLRVENDIDPVVVADVAAADGRVDFIVRAPDQFEDQTHFLVQKATTIALTIDRDQWQTLIDGLGYSDFVLPEVADGAEVKFNIPDMVVMGIGDCEYNELNEVKVGDTEAHDCTVFSQSGAPTIEAPPGIDINRAGQIVLELLGLSAEEAKAFSSRVNWATTLVVPVPKGANYRNVTVDGVSGIFLEDLYSNQGELYTLMWVKDEMFYAVTGNGKLADAMDFVRSLE
jgi:hypothetical protein